MRLRTDHGPANMATVRHAALNLIQAIPDKASLAVKRKTAPGTTITCSRPSLIDAHELQAIPLRN